ncbi:MAG: DUF4339 domain-containing protein [Verrucomicrobiae bacterium]|nr:DUF4339 domain-containing protein [Verrucomicrobiae bacterium]
METEWHYATGDARRGPVTGHQLRERLRTGEIDDGTLVWREGFADWKPLGECRTEIEAVSPETGDDPTPRVLCAWSGETRPEAAMLRFGDHWVAPEHKDAFVQALREGGEEAALHSVSEENDSNPFPATLNLFDIVAQSWKIWRKNLAAIAMVTAVIWLPTNLLLEWMDSRLLNDDANFKEIAQSYRRDQAAEFWIGIIVVGAVMTAARRMWDREDRLGIGEAFAEGFANWPRLWGTGFLLLLFVFLFTLIVFAPLAVLFGSLGDFAIVIPATAFGVVIVVYLVRFGFVRAAAIDSSEGGTAAFRRSWQATRGRFWRVIGYQMVVFGVLISLTLVLGLLSALPFLDRLVPSAILGTGINLILTFGTVESFVLYRHLRDKAR